MKTRTVTVREGEYLGETDWGYDFRGHFNNYCTSKEGQDKICEEYMERFKKLAESPDRYQATSYGGWPRCGWGNVVYVGMYDGWPYWKPTPSVCLTHSLGGVEWHPFSSITDIREKPNN